MQNTNDIQTSAINNSEKINLLTIGEASEYLGISIDTLRRWERKGRVEPLRSPGGHRYYSKIDLDNLFGKRYVRTEPTIRPSGPYGNTEIKTKSEEVTIEETVTKNGETITEEVIKDQEIIITNPTFEHTASFDQVSGSYESDFPNLPLTSSDPVVLDRPTREVKIPEVSRVKVISQDAVITPNESYFGQESISILTPHESIAQSVLQTSSVPSTSIEHTPPNEANVTAPVSIIDPIPYRSVQEPIVNTKKSELLISKKALILIAISLGIILLSISWYFLWVSSQKILPQAI